MAFIQIKDLTYYYPNTRKPALDKINLEIPEGQFTLILGGSGSGKSSLVRAMAGLVPEFYGGNYTGAVYLDGRELRQMERRSVAKTVGMVFQDPESQLVMSNVEQEIAFGMENLGMPNDLMKRRLVEVTSALGLSDCLHSFVPELSGGQKQKVVLASVLAMQPQILILDEPTSQLDPVAGEEILSIIKRLNEESGITVILVEQRLEKCFHLADRILVLDKGRIVSDHKEPDALAYWALKNGSPFIPPLAKLFASVDFPEIPVTVKQGRKLLKPFYKLSKAALTADSRQKAEIKEVINNKPVLDMKNVWFTFENGTEALKNINLHLNPGDFTVVMGESGAGKTTLLKIINGLLKPGRGTVKLLNKDIRKSTVEEIALYAAYLTQNPNDYLFLPTVQEELGFNLKNLNLPDGEIVAEILSKLKLSSFKEANPRDLSTGERQRVALAAVLTVKPQLLLLDEPTRGLDYQLKGELGEILLQLKVQGTAVLAVTHDIEFAAEYATHVVLMADGSIIASGSKYEMLSNSPFYSPQINKLFSNQAEGIVTFKQGQEELKKLIKLSPRAISV
ncbi:MAG TPA: energy-coupling factor transporter ATPase [Syntrophomonadaceae bacterium]|nr:energy-coupling factor transporter ATPase [Syntrophomonadaceae bacterium]